MSGNKSQMMANPPAPNAGAYQPNPRERAQVTAYFDRQKRKPLAPRVILKNRGNTTEVSTNHQMPTLGHTLLMQAIGVTDPVLFDALLGQLINIGTQGQKPDERAVNAMLAMVRAVEPKDEVEVMLAAQMAAVHTATLRMARRLNHVDNIAQQDSASNAFNKLARTFAVQLEALKRYRTGGEQRVTVQHVTVNDGGQAIVGSVAPRPGGVGYDRKAEEQPSAAPARLAHDAAIGPSVPPVRSQDPIREAVPIARDE